MISDRARPGDERLPLSLLGMVPAVAAAGRAVDALWLAVGVLFVSVVSSSARWLLRGTDTAGTPGPSPGTLVQALVISSVLTAAFEAGLLAVAPSASASIGIYAPLVAVNLVVLEGNAPSGRSLAGSAGAALARGAALAVCLLAVALVRESLGAGTITLFPVDSFRGTIVIGPLLDRPVRALGLTGGALLCAGYLAGAFQWLARSGRRAEGPR